MKISKLSGKEAAELLAVLKRRLASGEFGHHPEAKLRASIAKLEQRIANVKSGRA